MLSLDIRQILTKLLASISRKSEEIQIIDLVNLFFIIVPVIGGILKAITTVAIIHIRVCESVISITDYSRDHIC